MTTQYAFSFDAKFCSGCKACQAACKDKNNLPVGVLWRRVYEVSGGNWQRNGDSWNNTVFAYNLSMSCNHCVHPKCAGVCPVDVYEIHDNGIVVLDSSKCLGCGYCAWACPYGAPQYNPQFGHMTKCDFCLDQLELGLPPACVAACPMRVLDYGATETEEGIALWDIPPESHPFPLPVYSHTQPRLAITSHPAMQTLQEKFVANLEEIQPRISSPWEEVPLIVFTLLTQLAVGGFWMLWVLMERGMTTFGLIPHLMIGASLGTGMLASFVHLGTKRNAWRVLAHLRRSWLSREILFAGLFGLGWLSTILAGVTRLQVTYDTAALTSIFGIGLVYSMGQVYRIPAAPGWNTWRTNASFMVSALLLGVSVNVPVLVYGLGKTGIQIPSLQLSSAILFLLLAQLALIQKRSFDRKYHQIRVGLLLIGIVVTVTGGLLHLNIFALTLLLIAVEEGLGRWLFYRSRME